MSENVQQVRSVGGRSSYDNYRVVAVTRLQLGLVQLHHTRYFQKVFAHWIPQLLTQEHKMQRLGAALHYLTLYTQEGPVLQNRIITGDEM